MDTIHKYIIDPSKPEINMPALAEILTAAFQGESLCLWARVNTNNQLRTRSFYAFGTGHEIPRQIGFKFMYTGTGFMHNGLVFHVFERLGV